MFNEGGLYRVVTANGDKFVGEYDRRTGDVENSTHDFSAIAGIKNKDYDPFYMHSSTEKLRFKRTYQDVWEKEPLFGLRDDSIESIFPVDPDFTKWVDTGEPI